MMRPAMTCCAPGAVVGMMSGCPGEEATAINRSRTSEAVINGIGSLRPEVELSPSGNPCVSVPVSCIGSAGPCAPFAGDEVKNRASIFARTSACSALITALGRALVSLPAGGGKEAPGCSVGVGGDGCVGAGGDGGGGR